MSVPRVDEPTGAGGEVEVDEEVDVAENVGRLTEGGNVMVGNMEDDA